MATTVLGDLVWQINGDTADFDKKLSNTQKAAIRFGDRLKSVGDTLTKRLTVPIGLAAGASVKFASDLQESTNAVNVVFGESAQVIQDWGKTAAENAGLSQSAFNETATIIGAQLKSTGNDIQTVADDTITLTQRAADLASVFNTEVTEATVALGAALRGETEPARRFAINISDAAVQSKALELGLVASKKEINEQIKVQARYALILEQSEQVAGDFKNTNDGAANALRVVKAQAVNLAASLGTELLPIIEDGLAFVRGLTERFAELDDGQKKLVIAVGAVAFAIGPVIGAIGTLTTAIATLNTTALFGPVGLIIGLSALAAGLIALDLVKASKRTEVLAERFADLAEETGVAAGNVERFAKAGEMVEDALARGQINATFEDTKEQVGILADNLNLSEEQIVKIGLQSDKLNDNFKGILRSVQEQVGQEAQIEELNREKLFLIKEAAVARKEVIELVEEEEKAVDILALKEKARVDGVIEARKEATKTFETELDLIQRRLDLEVISQQEALEQRIEAEQDFQDQLLAIGFDGLENAQKQLDIGDRQLLDSIERRTLLEEQYTAATEFEAEKRRKKREEELLTAETDTLAFFASASEAVNGYTISTEDQTKRIRDFWSNTASTISTRVTSSFEDVGKALVEGESGWAALGRAAIGAIAETVRALGAQLAAEAALLYAKAFFTFGATVPSAVAATAASAAAFTAAGAIEASAQKFQEGGFVQSVPGIPSRGDNVPALLNPGELILTPEDQALLLDTIRNPRSTGITVNQYNTLNTDSQQNLEKAARILTPFMEGEKTRLGNG